MSGLEHTAVEEPQCRYCGKMACQGNCDELVESVTMKAVQQFTQEILQAISFQVSQKYQEAKRQFEAIDPAKVDTEADAVKSAKLEAYMTSLNYIAEAYEAVDKTTDVGIIKDVLKG